MEKREIKAKEIKGDNGRVSIRLLPSMKERYDWALRQEQITQTHHLTEVIRKYVREMEREYKHNLGGKNENQ